MIADRRQYRYQPPTPKGSVSVNDFSQGMNTRDVEQLVVVRSAKNARLGRSAGFKKRPGYVRKGNQIGTAGKVLGLHSYVKKDGTAQLLAGYGTDIYYYTDVGTLTSITTSSQARATGYSKDRHLMFTTAVDTSGNPYLVATYQSGSGIILRSASLPYTSWSSPTTIDASTALGWSCFIDSSDNIHVAYMDSANSVKYVKLTYSAGPSWSVGTKRSVYGTGVSDQAVSPTITVQTGGRIHIAFRYYNGTNYVNQAVYSTDSGVTWTTPVTLGTTSTNTTYAIACAVVGDTPYFMTQEDTSGAGTAYSFNLYIWNTSYLYVKNVVNSATATLNEFSVTNPADGLVLSYDATATSSGISATGFGTAIGASYRTFTVVNDGVNDNDIQYKNTVGGATDLTATRVSNDTNSNKYPSSPLTVSTSAAYIPTLFVTGTSNPYSIKINAQVQWVATSSSLTTGLTQESTVFRKSASGGTDKIYFVNGTDACKSWDGTTLASATATNYPVAKGVIAYDDRLWFYNINGVENEMQYSPQGSDNFTGTFASSGNRLFLNGYITGAIVFREVILMVFTRTTIYTIQGYDYAGSDGTQKIVSIPNSYGTLSGRTIRQIGPWVYYQSPDGQIRRTNGSYVEQLPVSDIIRSTMSAFSLSQLQLAAAGQLNDYYHLSVTGAASGQNDTVVVLDTIKAPEGGFSLDIGRYASSFVTHPDANGVPQLFFGESRTTNGSVYLDGSGTSDNGTAIEMELITGVLEYGSAFYKKQLRDTLVKAVASGTATLTHGVAPSKNLTSFVNQVKSLATGAVIWGQFVWGSFTWGGATNVELRYIGNMTGLGFKHRFYNNSLTDSISVTSFTDTFDSFTDRL